MNIGMIMIRDKPISRVANGMKDVNKRIETQKKEISRMSSTGASSASLYIKPKVVGLLVRIRVGLQEPTVLEWDSTLSVLKKRIRAF